MHIKLFIIEFCYYLKMKSLSIISILLFIFILNVKSDVDYTPEGCFGTTGCWTYCSNLMGTCSSPFKEVTETGSNGGNICYCYRPYTEEELNKKNAGQCERYTKQCLTLSSASVSCANALNKCDKNQKKELCVKGIKLKEVAQKNMLGYYCLKKGIIDIKGKPKY